MKRGKKKRLSDRTAVTDKVLENEKRRETGRERPPPFYLSCHLVLAIHFPLFPFSLTLPSSVTLLSPPCSFLMLSPLTPQGSLSFRAFSCCFIYSLFNSPRCICSAFLSLEPLLHHLSLSQSPPTLFGFSHRLPLPYLPHFLKMRL